MLPRADGSLLALAADGRWRQYRDGVVAAESMPTGMPASSQFSQALLLKDGSLALAGVEGRLYLVDPQRKQLREFAVDGGTLSGLVVSSDGGLLSAGEDAVYHIAWPAPWSSVARTRELGGSLFCVRSWRGRWFANTGNGVYEALPGERYRRMDWSEHEVWDLLEISPQSALLAESYSLKLIEHDRATVIAGDLYPRLLQRSSRDPAVVYVATESGLAVARREGGRWQLKLRPAASRAMHVNSVVETGDHEVWIGTERDGVQWLRLAPDYGKIVESRSYGAGQGIQFGSLAGGEVNSYGDGKLVVTTKAGTYRWNQGYFVDEPLDGLSDLRGKEEWLSLARSPAGADWAYSDRHVFRRAPGGYWKREELAGVLQGAVLDVSFDADDSALFTTSGGILRHGGGGEPAREYQPPLVLRSVEKLGAGGERLRLPQHSTQPASFEEDRRLGFVFRFALPEMRLREAVRYQARLLGLHDNFSDWSEATTFSYSRLEPGDYRFEARARNAIGQISELEPYEFQVSPHWYASVWGRALLVLAGVIALALLNALLTEWRTRRLHADKLRLEGMVAQRTRELESANHQLHAMANLDELTEIPNRRRLDDYLAEVWQQCIAKGRPMSVLVIDGDRFKAYNDSQGHLAGDQLLKQLADVLSSCLRRAEDLVARYGGDEFVVVMPGAGLEMAGQVAEAMRRKVEEAQLGVTISIGTASHAPRADEPVSTMVHEADEALYQAKHGGRNRVVQFPGAQS